MNFKEYVENMNYQKSTLIRMIDLRNALYSSATSVSGVRNDIEKVQGGKGKTKADNIDKVYDLDCSIVEASKEYVYTKKQLKRMLSQLHPLQRSLIIGIVFKGKSFRTMSRQLHKRFDTVKQEYNDALTKLDVLCNSTEAS